MLSALETHYTPAEAAALVDVPEKRVRKEMEYHVVSVDERTTLRFAAVAYLHLVASAQLGFPVKTRTRLYQLIRAALERGETEDIRVTPGIYLRAARIDELALRISSFIDWKDRLGSKPDVMGGATVFPNTRLTVRHVGGMLNRGVEPAEILEDYPHLDEQDLDFAKLYVRAYPKRGRPRKAQ